MMEFQDIERAGLELQNKITARLIHDDNYTRGIVVNFSPKDIADDGRNA